MPTELMCNCKGCLQTVIFNNGATSIRITHGANIRHPQSVTGMSSTKILKGTAFISMSRAT